jgi:hypothetical protein
LLVFFWPLSDDPAPTIPVVLVTLVLAAIFEKALIMPINQWITELLCLAPWLFIN